MKKRLDQVLVERGLFSTRSQAENLVKLELIQINGKIIKKPGYLISENDEIKLLTDEKYVSRAALKLKSVANKLNINFQNKIVLDVGSSTGGFTDFALQHGAKRVIAVDVGTNQLHPSLLTDKRIELHEKTDIREVRLRIGDWGLGKEAEDPQSSVFYLQSAPDIILIDVSFISLREILPHVTTLMGKSSELVAMVKPQFEAGDSYKHKGVIKNDKIRRNTLKQFENWTQKLFIIVDKADSEVAGAKGNIERFYLLKVNSK